MSISVLDGDANKENVAPFFTDIVSHSSSSTSARAARALRRTSTELLTPSRSKASKLHHSLDSVYTNATHFLGPRRNASTSSLFSTPEAAVSRLTLATPPPTPPTALLPIYARARALLRTTCNGTAQIAGRDQERNAILKFVTTLTKDCSARNDNVSTLYISGSPGTGKTALVNSVLRTLDATVKVVSINCMALNSVDALWDQLLDEFDRGKKGKTTGRGKKMRGKEGVETILSELQTKW